MFKIGEFSKLTQVSVRMLRYYDASGLLKPAQTDPLTGYRLYAADQIAALRKIVFLRDLGFGIAEIAHVLAGWNSQEIACTLEAKYKETQNEIEESQSRLTQLSLAMENLAAHNTPLPHTVAIKQVPACFVLSLRRTVENYYTEGNLWKELTAFAAKNRIPISQNCFTIYHDTDYREHAVDMELCTPIAKLVPAADGFTCRLTEPVPHMAYTLVHGPFESIAGAYHAFAGWLETHAQYKMAGTSRQIVHRGPWNEQDAQNYITEIQIPLTER